ncbi:MAG: hypothetical protein VW378_05840 [bacterium]
MKIIGFLKILFYEIVIELGNAPSIKNQPSKILTALFGLFLGIWVWQHSLKNQLDILNQSCTQSMFELSILYDQKINILTNNIENKQTNTSIPPINKAYINLRQKINQSKKEQDPLKKIQLYNEIEQTLHSLNTASNQHKNTTTISPLNKRINIQQNIYNTHANYLNNKITLVPYTWIASYYNIESKQLLEKTTTPTIIF